MVAFRNPDYFYTPHALKRMGQRGITRDQIRTVIGEPHIQHPGKNHGTTVVERVFRDGRKLRVVYEQKKSRYVIVTAMWRE